MLPCLRLSIPHPLVGCQEPWVVSATKHSLVLWFYGYDGPKGPLCLRCHRSAFTHISTRMRGVLPGMPLYLVIVLSNSMEASGMWFL